ncbi:biotin--[acetyl-CoA-carboxylase] ligase [Cupriavidus oxalaticus]|uniref:biotin--[biotin carboxyl-carrier protein] ligase n=1 Tax=Cupriavidus oxalaticus TaxID=96344 RepID=A0A375FYQ5_9BURK|nr:biotin--[acetyl-CoA-carboxylase] ligase [Cupriavidus oxalaticus]QRQ87306.1 biotin--[acetyl-CoA-carboxylase] ligase [Cupriavidus oxalaticus]QRQ94366.1 biotin--[acetyl-CoA-carboxylase] ligase [Cupriavidus oxalaticus]WQD83008.1 biotin--[acetyl-CoA-carboxylase] ligase [Cupriavidus oxalaticus]SPC06029.1 BIOTIN-(ACETYL-COA-CARBOXYLASE) SYNTHETASE [Cupriavidus oxalaticus]SPC10948.1 Biotin-(Acetyl-CoA carboxylase) ligase [Cupriavidus oxalaticus]
MPDAPDTSLTPASGPSAPWRIDPAALRAALSPALRDWTLELVEETGSTNADLTAACRQVPWSDAGWLRLAYRQTAGRGRLGRPWQGQAGMTFSVALPFALAPAQLTGLSLAVGLALAEALGDVDARLGARVGLKWPNDLQIDGRKLAGILIESVPAGPNRIWAVIGIGLNLVRDAQMEAALGRELAGVAEAMPGFDASRDAARLLAAVVERLASMRTAFLAHGFGPMAPRWSAADAYRDQPVRLLHDGKVIAEGMARGVDEAGQLLLETPAGLERVASGELSLRPAPGQEDGA